MKSLIIELIKSESICFLIAWLIGTLIAKITNKIVKLKRKPKLKYSWEYKNTRKDRDAFRELCGCIIKCEECYVECNFTNSLLNENPEDWKGQCINELL